MVEKNLPTAYLADSEVKLHNGFYGKNGFRVEVEFPATARQPSSRKSLLVWDLMFPDRKTVDQIFSEFFGKTVEEAIRTDRRRKVIKKDGSIQNILKIKEATEMAA